MIKQVFRLSRVDYRITLYYAVHGYHVDAIMDDLTRIGVSENNLKRAYKNLTSGEVNTGMAFVNNGEGLAVIGKASEAAQYADSIQHEVMHLALFIGIAEDIPLDSEEVCYIGGEIARKMHPVSKLLTSKCGCYTKKIGKKL